MKLLAVTAGRKNGNTEIIVKEALMAARELGAEIRMINLNDFNIKPCLGCWVCQDKAMERKKYECVFKDKDDMDRIMQVFLRMDGIIMAAPTYLLQPAAVFTLFMNRFHAYYHSLLYRAKMMDHIPHKVGAIIGVGNSTQHWMPMTLPVLYTAMCAQNVKVVDQLLAGRSLHPGQVLFNEAAMAKAANIGRKLVKAMQMLWEEVSWMGDEEGWCPVCHSNLLMQGRPRWNGLSYPVECAVCGAGGNLEFHNGKALFIVDPGSLKEQRLAQSAMKEHYKEVLYNMERYDQDAEKIKTLAEKYREVTVPGIP